MPYRGMTYTGGYTIPAAEFASEALKQQGLEDFVPTDPAVLRANAQDALRRAGISATLSQNAYSLARNIAAETGSGSAEQKVAMGLSTVNQARRRGISVHDLVVLNNRWSNRYGRIHQHGETSSAPYGRFTASSKEPTIEDLMIAMFILDGGAGTFPNDFARGADDQAQVRSDSWVRTLAQKRSYWVGPLPGVDAAKVTLFRSMPEIAPDGPDGKALLSRALTMLDLPPGPVVASGVAVRPRTKVMVATAGMALGAGALYWLLRPGSRVRLPFLGSAGHRPSIARLKSFLDSEEAYALLDRRLTWNAGGCWILAEAVKKWIGPGAELFAIGTVRVPVHHVVVRVGDTYIDGDGAQSRTELLRKMETMEFMREPKLTKLDRRLARKGGIVCPNVSVTKLTELIRRRVGSP
jgi:hypothetical protein